MRNLINKAQKTLLGNRRKGYTLPTNNKLYPAQWNWDSAFIALGYSYFNLNHALKEITTLLDGQWKDGMVPHIYFMIQIQTIIQIILRGIVGIKFILLE